jgi:hypothetical protein
LLPFSHIVVLLLDWIPISCLIHLLHISTSLNLYCNCSLEHRFRFRAIVAKNCRSGVVSLPVSVQFYCRFFSRLATANHIRASFFIHWFNILSGWCFVIWLILYKWLKCAVSWLVGSFSDSTLQFILDSAPKVFVKSSLLKAEKDCALLFD